MELALQTEKSYWQYPTLLIGIWLFFLPSDAFALITVGALDTPGQAYGVDVIEGLVYLDRVSISELSERTGVNARRLRE